MLQPRAAQLSFESCDAIGWNTYENAITSLQWDSPCFLTRTSKAVTRIYYCLFCSLHSQWNQLNDPDQASAGQMLGYHIHFDQQIPVPSISSIRKSVLKMKMIIHGSHNTSGSLQTWKSWHPCTSVIWHCWYGQSYWTVQKIFPSS